MEPEPKRPTYKSLQEDLGIDFEVDGKPDDIDYDYLMEHAIREAHRAAFHSGSKEKMGHALTSMAFSQLAQSIAFGRWAKENLQ